jgi:hypothetical protein
LRLFARLRRPWRIFTRVFVAHSTRPDKSLSGNWCLSG